MNDQANMPATLRSLSEIVREYDEKTAEASERIAEFNEARTAVEMASTIGGAYVGSVWSRGASPSVSERDMQNNLLRSAWKHVYDGLQIAKIAPASERARYERELERPPEFTLDNIRANFGDYLARPQDHILRGLAEVFSSLDPAFRSHNNVKIGTTALPKRVILSGFGEFSYGSWGQERMRDMLNALASLTGREHVHSGHVSDMVREARKSGGTADWWGGRIKVFRNGNAHLFFDREALDIINRGLAEYYGDVLPDTPDEDAVRQPGTDVARSLQFYRTPDQVADLIVDKAGPRSGARILEPSCGDGAILDAIARHSRATGNSYRCFGVEVDGQRARAAREKGHAVTTQNFLETTPSPEFDFVIMNPPFYGRHYQKHIEHARRFLKPAGVLYAILPVSAVEDHGYIKRPEWGRDAWEDLPVGSFAASGTNINTGIARFFAP